MTSFLLRLIMRPFVRRLHRRLDELEARLVDVHAHVYRSDVRKDRS